MCLLLVLPDRPYGDLCGLIIWKMKLPGGNTMFLPDLIRASLFNAPLRAILFTLSAANAGIRNLVPLRYNEVLSESQNSRKYNVF